MNLYIGIDIGKHTLDIYDGQNSFQIPNDALSIKKLIRNLKKTKLADNQQLIIVCEPTGGYESLLTKQLKQNHFPFHLAHANKIRAFAKSKGLLAKTDKIDAKLIAEYAKVMQVLPDDTLPEEVENLSEILKRREQLQLDKNREHNRLDKQLSPSVKRSIQAHIDWLEKELTKLNKWLEQKSQNEVISQRVDLLTSIPAIGNQTALTLIAFLPELGHAEHGQLTALVGLAPFNRDSGSYRGKRYIQGGRAIVRKALYMAAVASLRWNMELATYYQRLRKSGKPAKVALVAVMRKLLHMLNSIMKRQSPWQKKLTSIVDF